MANTPQRPWAWNEGVDLQPSGNCSNAISFTPQFSDLAGESRLQYVLFCELLPQLTPVSELHRRNPAQARDLR